MLPIQEVAGTPLWLLMCPRRRNTEQSHIQRVHKTIIICHFTVTMQQTTTKGGKSAWRLIRIITSHSFKDHSQENANMNLFVMATNASINVPDLSRHLHTSWAQADSLVIASSTTLGSQPSANIYTSMLEPLSYPVHKIGRENRGETERESGEIKTENKGETAREGGDRERGGETER